MTVRKLYPNGKRKAFSLSYDDGVTADIRLIELINRYRLKGTFNLNSGLMEKEFEWRHETGSVIKRLPPEKAKALYRGHEIASHTLSHPYLDTLERDEILYELREDKRRLEELFGAEIRGFALPFSRYSGLIEECARSCGFEYARISEESRSFLPRTDYFHWRPGIFHTDAGLEDFIKAFLESDEELAFCQIVGHSYDLDVENAWERLESVFRLISAREDILSMTTIELVDYFKAMGKAHITEEYIVNESDTELWFSVDGRIFSVKPKETIQRTR